MFCQIKVSKPEHVPKNFVSVAYLISMMTPADGSAIRKAAAQGRVNSVQVIRKDGQKSGPVYIDPDSFVNLHGKSAHLPERVKKALAGERTIPPQMARRLAKQAEQAKQQIAVATETSKVIAAALPEVTPAGVVNDRGIQLLERLVTLQEQQIAALNVTAESLQRLEAVWK